MGGFARTLDCAVISSAHSSLAGIRSGDGSSGSTGWEAAFRSRLYLARPETEEGEQPDQYARTLYRKKANWAVREDQITLRWAGGVFNRPITSQGILGSIEKRRCEGVFLDLLAACIADNRILSPNAHSSNYAPLIFARRPDRAGYKLADFQRAMETLFANREITITQTRGADRHVRDVLSITSARTNGHAK
jgi:RecA-family ATPase